MTSKLSSASALAAAVDAFGLGDAVTALAQEEREGGPRGGLVVDDENRRHGVSPRPREGGS